MHEDSSTDGLAPVLTTVSRRRLVHTVAGVTVAGALFGMVSVPAAAQRTTEATPVAPGPSMMSEEVEFVLSGGVTTRGQFDYPATGTPPFPTVLLLQGSGPIDRHETFVEPDGAVRQPFVQMSKALTERGLAVFRFDKRGVCPPSQPCDPAVYAAQTKPVLTEDAILA